VDGRTLSLPCFFSWDLTFLPLDSFFFQRFCSRLIRVSLFSIDLSPSRETPSLFPFQRSSRDGLFFLRFVVFPAAQAFRRPVPEEIEGLSENRSLFFCGRFITVSAMPPFLSKFCRGGCPPFFLENATNCDPPGRPRGLLFCKFSTFFPPLPASARASFGKFRMVPLSFEKRFTSLSSPSLESRFSPSGDDHGRFFAGLAK